jgi:hypothetical protein
VAPVSKGKETLTDPYISVVVTTRNDNYGENMRRRLDMFVQGLDQHQRKYPGLFELVIVEWNPPGDQEPLSTIIPSCTDLPIRIITVPNEYHISTGVRRPLAEFPAKNVGLRRAKGQFVLISNPDILFSTDLVDRLAERNLKDGAVYRCDRYDFDGDGIESIDPCNYLEFAFRRIFRLHGMGGSWSISITADTNTSIQIPIAPYNENIIHTNGAGDFMLISKTTAELVGGFYQGLACSGHHDSVSMTRFVNRGLKQGIFRFPCAILHQDHDRNMLPGTFNPTAVIETVQLADEDLNWGFCGVEFEQWTNQQG